jgi:hypothetical protein
MPQPRSLVEASAPYQIFPSDEKDRRPARFVPGLRTVFSIQLKFEFTDHPKFHRQKSAIGG